MVRPVPGKSVLLRNAAEVRRKNFPRADEFPFHTATGLDYDSGNYEAALDKAQGMIGYAALREEQKKARDEGRLLGIGISTYVEICALGPSQAMPAGGWESATVRIEPTGKVTVLTRASPHGQGQETSFAQIAADERWKLKQLQALVSHRRRTDFFAPPCGGSQGSSAEFLAAEFFPSALPYDHAR